MIFIKKNPSSLQGTFYKSILFLNGRFFRPSVRNIFKKKKKKNLQPSGEITIKGAKGGKVKVLFQGLHMTCVILTLVYKLKIMYFRYFIQHYILNINTF